MQKAKELETRLSNALKSAKRHAEEVPHIVANVLRTEPSIAIRVGMGVQLASLAIILPFFGVYEVTGSSVTSIAYKIEMGGIAVFSTGTCIYVLGGIKQLIESRHGH